MGRTHFEPETAEDLIAWNADQLRHCVATLQRTRQHLLLARADMRDISAGGDLDRLRVMTASCVEMVLASLERLESRTGLDLDGPPPRSTSR